MTARHQPPAALPESLAAHRPRQERRLDRPVKPLPGGEPLDRHGASHLTRVFHAGANPPTYLPRQKPDVGPIQP
jgi:hypothetical protein